MSLHHAPTFSRVVELDQAQEAAMRAFGDVSLDVLGNTKGFRWETSVVQMGAMILRRNAVTGRLVISGVPSRYVISMPTAGQLCAASGSHKANIVDSTSMIAFSPGQSMSAEFQGGFHSHGTCIDPQFIQAQLHALTGETIQRPPTFAFETGATPFLRQLLLLLHQDVDSGLSALSHPLLSLSWSETIARALLLHHPHDYSYLLAHPTPPSSRRDVRLAEEYIDAHALEPIQMADLAHCTGTSLMALEASFLSNRNTTPAAFLRKRRLELARQLLRSNPETSVAHAAHAAGFLHKGTFENVYFKTFGEEPAQTLRRRHVTNDAMPAASGSQSTVASSQADLPLVLVGHHDPDTRHHICVVLRNEGYDVLASDSAQELLAVVSTNAICALVDVALSEPTGLELQSAIAKDCPSLPLVFLCKKDDASLAVALMKRGVVDVLIAPIEDAALLDAVRRGWKTQSEAQALLRDHDLTTARLKALSPRERDVCERVAKGQLNKQIAADLEISEATVKFHRARAMKRLGVTSTAELSSFFAIHLRPGTNRNP